MYPKKIAVITERTPGGIEVRYEGSTKLERFSWYARRGNGSTRSDYFAPGRKVKVWHRIWKGYMMGFFARIGG